MRFVGSDNVMFFRRQARIVVRREAIGWIEFTPNEQASPHIRAVVRSHSGDIIAEVDVKPEIANVLMNWWALGATFNNTELERMDPLTENDTWPR